ncbi:hypothetical protein JYU34_017736 [Plutella xylostella]|uniref:Uncharacterized protein n=1 Tax=Plutella xylostella TaxID=51655 RepID=A0ABQ7Q1V0_PLUXY|nr:hypothetical protein JYU34_017736 [Plutella xylostella]
MTSPLPLQLAYFDSYVGNLSPLTDNLISDTIHQRNPKHSSLHSTLSDFKSVDQSYRQCPRLCTIRHHWQDALVEDFCFQALRNGRREYVTKFPECSPTQLDAPCSLLVEVASA